MNEPEDEVYLIAGSEEVPGSSDIGHRDVWKTNDMNTWNQIVSDNTSSLPWSGGSGWTTIFHDDYIWQVTPYHVSKSTDGINWTTTNANPPYSSYPGIRLGYSVDSWNGYLWITGGRANNTSLNDVWKSVDGVTWVQVTTSAAWGERKDHESFVFNNKLWIMGGQDMSLSWPYYVNDIWSSLDGVNWTNEGLTPWYNKVDGATVVHEGAIYTAGGGYGGVDTNDVWKSIDGANWTQINTAASWSARVLHDLVSYDGKLWVVGGRDVPTSYLDPVVPTNGQVWSSIDGINWSINTNTPWNNRSRHKVIVNEVQDIVAY